MSQFGRRDFIQRLGWGAVACFSFAPIARLFTCFGSDIRPSNGAPPTNSAAHLALLNPLKVNDKLANMTIVSIEKRSDHIGIGMLCSKGGRVHLEVFCRDDDLRAHPPVARTERFDIFLANGGKGHKPTETEHGLAAYSLATVLRNNEDLPVKIRLHKHCDRSHS